IKCDNAAIEKNLRIDRGLDSTRVTIEEAYAECVLHVGDRLRYRGLGHRELCSSLAHAAAPSHGQQDVKIVQLHAMAHASFIPVHRAAHQKTLWRHRKIILVIYVERRHTGGWNALSFCNAGADHDHPEDFHADTDGACRRRIERK